MKPAIWQAVFSVLRGGRFSRANGAAAFSCAGSRVDGSLPDVPQRTRPPDLFPAARRDHFGRERAVHRRVPLGGDTRLDGRQIIESGEYLFVRAVRTAAAVDARGDDRLIAVSFLADPPRLAVARGCDLLCRQPPVFLRVPLRGKRRVLRRKIVEARQHLPSCADRAAAPAVRPRGDRGLPVMPVRTDPPDLFLCPRWNVSGRKLAVAPEIPLLRQFRIRRRKVVLSNENLPPGADRTAIARYA